MRVKEEGGGNGREERNKILKERWVQRIKNRYDGALKYSLHKPKNTNLFFARVTPLELPFCSSPYLLTRVDKSTGSNQVKKEDRWD